MKPLIIDAYTSDRILYEVYFPRKSTSLLSEPWKQTKSKYLVNNPHLVDNSTNYNSTIKRCHGIYEYIKSGFIIPLWADFSILVSKDYVSVVGGKNYKDNTTIHDEKQGGEVIKDYHIIKLNSPWVFSTNVDIPFLFTTNFYDTLSNEQNFIISPGIADFKYQSGTHIFLLVKKSDTPKEIILKLGTPLLKLIPLTQQPVEIKTHLVENLNFYAKVSSSFSLNVAKTKNFIRKFI